MSHDTPTGTINIDTGLVAGQIKDNHPFEFITSTPVPNDVTITGLDDQSQPCAWFSDGVNPAGTTVITAGNQTIQVTAELSSLPWYTYRVTGRVCPTNVHVVVSSGVPIPKAS